MVNCSCGHDERFHAVPEKHILGTSHCTSVYDKKGAVNICQCERFI
jgi:hypothetical protein